MDFTFSSEQQAMRDAVRGVLRVRAAAPYVRSMIDDPVGISADLWHTMAELGWLGILAQTGADRSRSPMVDLVVVQEELGRVPLPGPFVSSAVAATAAAVRLGLDDLLEDLTAGQRRGTIAVEEAGFGDPLGTVRCWARPSAERAGTWDLHGIKPIVLDGATADWALVVADDGTGLAGFLVDPVGGEPVPALDVTRNVARVALDGHSAQRVGPSGDQTALWRRVLDDVAVAICAELVGTCEQALQLAVEYAKARVQFGRPIATFQVIKHKAADMLHHLELARVATHYAAWASDTEAPEREEAVAMAKGFVGEAASLVTAECIQIHGGAGFTWDADCHLLFRRAKQDDILFGAQGWQRRRLADLLLGSVGAGTGSEDRGGSGSNIG